MDKEKELFLDQKIAHMSLEEKIGQLFYMDYRNIKEMDESLRNILETYQPGGFLLFKSNIKDFEQLKKFIKDIKELLRIPIFIGIDQEGGRVQRIKNIKNFTDIPSMLEIGKTKDPGYAYEMGKRMGQELHSLGINMDMAPVLDILSNPKNTVIGDRSFGMDEDTVSKMGIAFSKGLKHSRVIPVGKHFPGHGDTTVDSHIDLPIIYKTYEELKKFELVPFLEAIKNNLDVIMLGHLAVPFITHDMLPASLSPIMIQDILRKDLQFQGIILTDSVKMKALTNYFSEEEIYLRVICSGNDMILMPQNIDLAFHTIFQAVLQGKIRKQELDCSVKRILAIKYDYGLFTK